MTEFKPGDMVRITSKIEQYNGLVGVFVEDARGTNYLVRPLSSRPFSPWNFTHEEVTLERVHILTHDELSVLDAGMVGVNQEASATLDRHLRPTVKRTFTVMVEQPTDAAKPVNPWYIEHMLTTGDQTGLRVTIEEQKP